MRDEEYPTLAKNKTAKVGTRIVWDRSLPTHASCITLPTNNATDEGHAMLAPFSFAGDSDEKGDCQSLPEPMVGFLCCGTGIGGAGSVQSDSYRGRLARSAQAHLSRQDGVSRRCWTLD